MAYNQHRESATLNLFTLLGITEPTDEQQVVAERFVENMTLYVRCKIGY